MDKEKFAQLDATLTDAMGRILGDGPGAQEKIAAYKRRVEEARAGNVSEKDKTEVELVKILGRHLVDCCKQYEPSVALTAITWATSAVMVAAGLGTSEPVEIAIREQHKANLESLEKHMTEKLGLTRAALFMEKFNQGGR